MPLQPTNSHQQHLLDLATETGISIDKHSTYSNGFLVTIPGKPSALFYGEAAVYDHLSQVLSNVELLPRTVLESIVRELQDKFTQNGDCIEWDNRDVATAVYHFLDRYNLLP